MIRKSPFGGILIPSIAINCNCLQGYKVILTKQDLREYLENPDFDKILVLDDESIGEAYREKYNE